MLVQNLHAQLVAAQIPFEILCFDDAENSEHHAKNNALNQLEKVTYRVNKTPLGRSKNRNALAETSCYNFLLFLDGDADISNQPNFISTYLNFATPDGVVCGGTAYQPNVPTNQTFLLRYFYGKNREEKTAAIRQQEPWNGFSAFNFLLPRHIFMELKFDENLSDYGHEDTLFGNELKYRCIPVHHVENAATHLGLDSSQEFLEKTKKGVENLRKLIDAGLVDEDVKLYAWYAKTHMFFANTILAALYKRFYKNWEAQLCGKNPTLKLFDLYKLAYLCTLPVHHRKPPERKI